MLFRFLGPSARARLGFVHDCIMAAAALLLAFYLRLGDEWLMHSPPPETTGLPSSSTCGLPW